MFRYPIFALFGAALGIAMIAAGNRQQGIPVAALGAFAGTLLATKGTSPSRTLRLLAAVTFAKNNPIRHDKAFEWVDDGSQPVKSDDFGERVFNWLIAPHIVNPRHWLVFAGLIFGTIAGIIVALRDYSVVNADGQGWMLPIRGARDPLLTQAGIVALGWIIWGGAIGGFFASAVFRRPLFLAVAFAFVRVCIGWATMGEGPVSTFSIMVFFSTGAAVVALIWGICISSKNRSPHQESLGDEVDSFRS